MGIANTIRIDFGNFADIWNVLARDYLDMPYLAIGFILEMMHRASFASGRAARQQKRMIIGYCKGVVKNTAKPSKLGKKRGERLEIVWVQLDGV